MQGEGAKPTMERWNYAHLITLSIGVGFDSEIVRIDSEIVIIDSENFHNKIEL